MKDTYIPAPLKKGTNSFSNVRKFRVFFFFFFFFFLFCNENGEKVLMKVTTFVVWKNLKTTPVAPPIFYSDVPKSETHRTKTLCFLTILEENVEVLP